MASRAALPLAACASTTPSRMRYSPSSAPAPLRPPFRQRRKPPSGGTRCATRSSAILKRRALPRSGLPSIRRCRSGQPACRRRVGGTLEQGARACRRGRRQNCRSRRNYTDTRRRSGLVRRARRRSEERVDRSLNGCSAEEAHRAHRHPRGDRRYRPGGGGDRACCPLGRRCPQRDTSAQTPARSAQQHLGRRDRAVRQLVLIADDDLIVGILNGNGLVTGNGNRWTRERVTSLRSHHRIPVHKPAEDGVEPWLQLKQSRTVSSHRRQDTPARGRSRRDPRDPSLAGWSVDLRPRRSLHPGSPNHHGTGAAEPETPRGIASRSTRPVSFNDIDRWVF